MTDNSEPAAASGASAERMDKLFALYLETAEKVSERRAKANAWMLTINTALTGAYGALAKDAALASAAPLWRWGVPLAGLLVCLAWLRLIESYGGLNRAKFLTLQEMEKHLPFQPFAYEQSLYRAAKRRRFTIVERLIPLGFGALYILLFVAAFWT